MNMSFKKILAGATVVAVVAMNMSYLTVSAAALNGATAVVTAATKIVVTSATNFTGATTCTATITRTNTNGTTTPIALTAGLCAVTDVNSLTVNSTNVTAAEYYTVVFSTDNGIFGSVAVGNTTNNVAVTATVVPTLSMNISAPSIALGTLTTGGYAVGTVDIVTASNAVSGVDVTMTSLGLADTVVGKEIGVVDINGSSTLTTATDYYKVQSSVASIAPIAQVFTDANGAGGAGVAEFTAAGTDMTASQVIMNSTNPTNSSTTTTVSIGAKISATTEAGNYADTLTFTVTGSF